MTKEKLKTILKINNLDVSIENKKILKEFELNIQENQIHVIMGPNGSGKSTLSKVLAGHSSYDIQKGSIQFCQQNLIEMSPENRSHQGLFLAFQYPLEISGVTNYDFLKIAYNEKRKYFNQEEINPLEFMGLIEKLITKLKIKTEFLSRNLNEGFSGGERKRNEILQMLLLEPKLIILDEIDSGLDIDTMKVIGQTIIENRIKDSSIILITHNPKMLQYLNPNYIHIMMDGRIVKTGNLELINQLESQGYESFCL